MGLWGRNMNQEWDFWTGMWIRMNFYPGSMPVKYLTLRSVKYTAMFRSNFLENTLSVEHSDNQQSLKDLQKKKSN